MNDIASRQVRTALLVDVAAVVIFAVIGRASHAESLSPGGLLRTSVPFLIGLVVGWAVVVLARTPAAGWVSGLIVWATTLGVGMAIRHFTGQGVAVAFVAVAGTFLALFLVGWRLARAGWRARTRTSAGRAH